MLPPELRWPKNELSRRRVTSVVAPASGSRASQCGCRYVA